MLKVCVLPFRNIGLNIIQVNVHTPCFQKWPAANFITLLFLALFLRVALDLYLSARSGSLFGCRSSSLRGGRFGHSRLPEGRDLGRSRISIFWHISEGTGNNNKTRPANPPRQSRARKARRRCRQLERRPTTNIIARNSNHLSFYRTSTTSAWKFLEISEISFEMVEIPTRINLNWKQSIIMWLRQANRWPAGVFDSAEIQLFLGPFAVRP